MDSSFTSGEPISETEALNRIRQKDDPSQRCYAAWWLGRMRSQHQDAIPLLQEALDLDETPSESAIAVARSAARSLGKLQAQSALPQLIKALTNPDHGLREAAARSLGELGNPEALLPLLERLQSPGAQATVGNGLNLGEPCEALLEAIGQISITSGIKTNQEFQNCLAEFQNHSRPVVASAACRALLQLSANPKWADQMVALLQHPQLHIRRAALLDLGASGWRPAAEAISNCPAENSLKLIALRGLLEQPLGEPTPTTPGHRERELLRLMDELL
jgi:phycocyanobilin lyase alpha subunit